MNTKKNRYVGVVPFTSEQQDIFFGREKDKEKLAQLIRREQQILLYAKSGLGKSSLVNAGVVPLLKTEMLPIFVRFGTYQEGKSQTLVETLLSSLPKKPTIFLDEKLPKQDSLWLHFKALQIQKEQTFLLVLDQFEEIFSYPEEQIIAFKKQVADLLLRETPLEISEWIEQNERQNTDFLTEEEDDSIWQKSTVKVLTIIREDRYSLMNRLTDYLPYILNNRYQLASLDQNQARQAIVEPAQKEGDFESEKFVYQKPALDKIVKFLTKEYTQEIETTQLQILCNRLENLKLTEITANDIPNFEDIFLQFYEDTITKIKDTSEQLKARRFVENELIQQEQRISLDALVSIKFVKKDTLKIIVDTHLLNTQENSIGRISYELAHDTLVTPILQAKRKREKEEEVIERERLQKEELRIANEKAEKDKREKKKTDKQLFITRLALGGVLVALIFVIQVMFYAFEKEKEAEKEKEKTEIALNKSDKLINAFYFYDDKFALASNINRNFYFINKEGEKIIKLGEWDKAEQFPEFGNGFTKTWLNNIEYYLDTLGQVFRVVYDIEDINRETTALDLDNLNKFPTKILKYSRLEVLILRFKIKKNNATKLPKNISNLENLKTLNLSFSKITTLPTGIEQLNKLQVLNLNYNDLMELPKEIGKLKKLRILNLNHNDLTRLPKEIGSLKKLQELHLDFNKLALLPHSLGELNKLTKLIIGANNLTFFPKMVLRLNNLKELDIGFNKIENIPSEIKNLKSLEYFTLRGNNLKSLSDKICSLENLRHLDLSSNNINHISDSIGKLENLEILSLEKNELKELPTGIGKLRNLKLLYLSNNRLRELPLSIGNLQSLAVLGLRGNAFSEEEKEKIRKLLPNCKITF